MAPTNHIQPQAVRDLKSCPKGPVRCLLMAVRPIKD